MRFGRPCRCLSAVTPAVDCDALQLPLGIKKGLTDVTRVRPLVGDLIWIQTRNLLIRSQMLYSVEL